MDEKEYENRLTRDYKSKPKRESFFKRLKTLIFSMEKMKAPKKNQGTRPPGTHGPTQYNNKANRYVYREEDARLLKIETSTLFYTDEPVDRGGLSVKPATVYVGLISLACFFYSIGSVHEFVTKNIPSIGGIVILLMYFFIGMGASLPIGGLLWSKLLFPEARVILRKAFQKWYIVLPALYVLRFIQANIHIFK